MAGTRGSEIKDVDQFIVDAQGLESEREKEIGQHIGYRYDVNLLPDYSGSRRSSSSIWSTWAGTT
jgi:hypothetical protein